MLSLRLASKATDREMLVTALLMVADEIRSGHTTGAEVGAGGSYEYGLLEG